MLSPFVANYLPSRYIVSGLGSARTGYVGSYLLFREAPQNFGYHDCKCITFTAAQLNSVLAPAKRHCHVEVTFGGVLHFNVVWCTHSRREIMLTIIAIRSRQTRLQSWREKILYSKRLVPFPAALAANRYGSDWSRRSEQFRARSVVYK